MDAGVTSFRSLLDKPLNQLTEEDISQLTREDCRKYLKDKGMRRPSWNKSQAIQQVISLKSLLETTTYSGKIPVLAPPPENPIQVSSASADSGKEASADVPISESPSLEEPTPSYRRKDVHKSIHGDDLPCRLPDTDNKGVGPSSSAGATKITVGQMTIFYGGKVNVYDGVPADKAEAIMHLAASSVNLVQDDPSSGAAPLCSFPCNLRSIDVKLDSIPPHATFSHTIQTEKITAHPQRLREEGNVSCEPDAEGQGNRKISLQRYLEKRKDRGRFKSRKKIGSSSSSLEMYLNHQVMTHTLTGQSSRSSTSSPPQPVVEGRTKNSGLSVDLNDNDIQEN